MKRLILFLAVLLCHSPLFAQSRLADGLTLKAGIKREILQRNDQRLSLPELEVAKQWGKRWYTSIDFSAMQKGDEYYYASTLCADLNILYSIYATKRNKVKAGTGMSYRYLRSEKLVSYSEDEYGYKSNKSFELKTFNVPGVNIIIEDEFAIYKSISLSARAGFQYYGQEMRSYMLAFKVGYTF